MRRSLVLSTLLAACTGEVEQQVGYFEPVRVPDGELVERALATDPDGPSITAIDASSGILDVGQLGRSLTGRTTADAYAIAMRLEGLGSGWWVRPVDEVDPAYPGERNFLLTYDVGGATPPGRHTLLLAAVDADGRLGEPASLDVCVRDDRVPDNLNACDPTIAPPALVITMQWDPGVDLDLVVEVPGGKRIGHSSPTAGKLVGSSVPDDTVADPRTGRLTRDSNAGCMVDGRNSEAVVFAEAPPAGSYHVYADLFDACGESGALFRVVVYRREAREGGAFALVEVARTDGAVLDSQAGGVAGPALFVTSVHQP